MSFLSGDVNQKHLTSEIVLPGAHDVRHKADTCISEMCFVSVQQIDLQEDTEFGFGVLAELISHMVDKCLYLWFNILSLMVVDLSFNVL